METRGVSNEMLTLYEAQCRAHETVLALQAQIEVEEAVYLEETPHGNIIRGWDGFIDSKQPRKDANLKKMKPYAESEHLFSSCCLYTSMASEPSFDQVDVYGSNNDENNTRRKLTVTLSVGKGASTAGSISGVVDSGITHSTNAVYKGSVATPVQKTNNTATHLVTGEDTAASSYQNSKASKLKKRKREAEAAEAMAATARLHETVSISMSTTTPVTTITPPLTTTATATIAAQPPASDFLDVL